MAVWPLQCSSNGEAWDGYGCFVSSRLARTLNFTSQMDSHRTQGQYIFRAKLSWGPSKLGGEPSLVGSVLVEGSRKGVLSPLKLFSFIPTAE